MKTSSPRRFDDGVAQSIRSQDSFLQSASPARLFANTSPTTRRLAAVLFQYLAHDTWAGSGPFPKPRPRHVGWRRRFSKTSPTTRGLAAALFQNLAHDTWAGGGAFPNVAHDTRASNSRHWPHPFADDCASNWQPHGAGKECVGRRRPPSTPGQADRTSDSSRPRTRPAACALRGSGSRRAEAKPDSSGENACRDRRWFR
jgi:hypothetical protein